MESEEYLALPVTHRPPPGMILEIRAVSIPIVTDILSVFLFLNPEHISIQLDLLRDHYSEIEDAYFSEQFRGRIPVDEIKVDDVWVESKWKALDDVLAGSNYVGLQEVTIYHDLPCEVMPDGYKCEDELLKKMLPKLGASNAQLKPCKASKLSLFGESEMCVYHRSVIHLLERSSCTINDFYTDREKKSLEKNTSAMKTHETKKRRERRREGNKLKVGNGRWSARRSDDRDVEVVNVLQHNTRLSVERCVFKPNFPND